MMEKLISGIKEKLEFMRKEYIYCNVEELLVKKVQNKWLSVSFAINSVFLVCLSLESPVSAYMSLMLLIVGVVSLFASLNFGNDINRINMWIFMKERM